MQILSRRPWGTAIASGLALGFACANVGSKAGISECRIDSLSTPGGGSVPIKWRVPSDNKRSRLDAWCSAVGPPVYEPGPGERQKTASGPLVIASWNVAVGVGQLAHFVGQLRAGEFTDGERPSDFVLLLQEVYRGSAAVRDCAALPPCADGAKRLPKKGEPRPRLEIVEAARQLELELFYVPSMRNGCDAGPPEDRGNAILSTRPLAGLTAIELPFEAQRRVAVAARIEVEGRDGRLWPLRVVSAHLDNARWRDPIGTLGALRERQARALVAALGDEAGEPTILGGDLNVWFREECEPAVRLLADHFDEPSSWPDGSTSKAGPFGRRIDYLFWRLPADASFSYQRLPNRYCSDHHPLVGRLR